MYYVYILHSMKDGRLYTGFTSDLKKRLNEHSTAKVKSTERRLPLKLIYYEAYLNRTDAKSREKFLKSGSGKRYIKKQLSNYFRITNPC
ncbi:MAG TPA: GIY-YIG nuclease family protein [bacterium]|nr:GIY-YIG nuclease family protein [bacterium]